MVASGEIAIDGRLRILVDQLDGAWEMLNARLHDRPPWHSDAAIWGDGATEGGESATTLTNDEYFWEPVPDCWSLRRKGHAGSGAPVGNGEWLLDNDRTTSATAPVTTIAWRMCHICVSPLFRYDYTFGGHSLSWDDVEWPATASAAVAFLTHAHLQWRNAVAEMSTEELDQIGRSQYPWGLDREVTFIGLLGWCNTEFIHHAAEIACLRDLYRQWAH